MRIDEMPVDALQEILTKCPERFRPTTQTRATLAIAVKTALAHAVKEPDVREER